MAIRSDLEHSRSYYAVESSDASGTPSESKFDTEAAARRGFEKKKSDPEIYDVLLLYYALGEAGIGQVLGSFSRPKPTICTLL